MTQNPMNGSKNNEFRYLRYIIIKINNLWIYKPYFQYVRSTRVLGRAIMDLRTKHVYAFYKQLGVNEFDPHIFDGRELHTNQS